MNIWGRMSSKTAILPRSASLAKLLARNFVFSAAAWTSAIEIVPASRNCSKIAMPWRSPPIHRRIVRSSWRNKRAACLSGDRLCLRFSFAHGGAGSAPARPPLPRRDVSGNFSSRCARPGKNVLHDWAAEHLDCHLSECNDPPAKI
jgi:hypothetical protein